MIKLGDTIGVNVDFKGVHSPAPEVSSFAEMSLQADVTTCAKT